MHSKSQVAWVKVLIISTSVLPGVKQLQHPLTYLNGVLLSFVYICRILWKIILLSASDLEQYFWMICLIYRQKRLTVLLS